MALVFIVLSGWLRRTRQLGLLSNCCQLSAGMDREHYMHPVCFIFLRLSSVSRARALKLVWRLKCQACPFLPLNSASLTCCELAQLEPS